MRESRSPDALVRDRFCEDIPLCQNPSKWANLGLKIAKAAIFPVFFSLNVPKTA